MDVSYVLFDSVKVAIRQKDKSCYVELATETNRYCISSDVWLIIAWILGCVWGIENVLFIMDRSVMF